MRVIGSFAKSSFPIILPHNNEAFCKASAKRSSNLLVSSSTPYTPPKNI
nr:MAG TPA: hypothetical protein [Caudoviricetes sp.]